MAKAVAKAAKAMAELYVWSAVEEILEGGTSPRSLHGQRAAARVIKVCKQQAQRCLREYDKHAATEGTAHD